MSFITSTLLALSIAGSAYTSPLSTSSYNAPSERSPFVPAEFVVADHPHGTVANSYIVGFRAEMSPALRSNHLNFVQAQHAVSSLAAEENCGLKHEYKFGYAGCFDDQTIEQIRAMPEVEYIERDQIVRINNDTLASPDIKVQKGAPWVSHSDVYNESYLHSDLFFIGSRSYQSPQQAQLVYFHKVRVRCECW